MITIFTSFLLLPLPHPAPSASPLPLKFMTSSIIIVLHTHTKPIESPLSVAHTYTFRANPFGIR